MENITPVDKKEEYILENVDYLMIKTIQQLTREIERLRRAINSK